MGIEKEFELELGSVLRGVFPSLEVSEPVWKDGRCELWFDRTQVWVDPISEHMLSVTLGDRRWNVIMERNLTAMCYLMIGFNNYGC